MEPDDGCRASRRRGSRRHRPPACGLDGAARPSSTGVDTFLGGEGCRRVALRVAEKRPVVVAPTLWMGLAEHHVGFGGTFSVSLSTYYALLLDLCDSTLRAGFSKILIVNSHGGNFAALVAMTTDLARDLKAPIGMTTLYTLPHATGAYAKVLEDQTEVRHACEAETSMMLAAFPDCVRTDKVPEAFGPSEISSPVKRPLVVFSPFTELTASGVMGDARRSSAAKGEKLFDVAVSLLAEKLIAGEPWRQANAPENPG